MSAHFARINKRSFSISPWLVVGCVIGVVFGIVMMSHIICETSRGGWGALKEVLKDANNFYSR